jgi:hypothetical protein
MGVLLTLVVIYVLLTLVVMLLQRGLMYFPTRYTPKQALSAAAENGLVPWRNQAGQIIGWELRASAPTTGAVLIVHGNAGSAVDRGYLAKPIHDAAPVEVFILEYPGYGARPGSPSERSLLAAGEEAFQMLTNEAPIYIVSESLGAGIAAHLAKTHGARVSGLMLFMPYNKLMSVAQSKMPIFPVWWLLWDRFDPADWLRSYRGPVKIALAERDEVIPMRFGRRLYETYQGPKSLQIFSKARHNDIAAQPPEWWQATFSFWQQNAKSQADP